MAARHPRALPPRLGADLSPRPDAVLDDDESWDRVEVAGDLSGGVADDLDVRASRLRAALLTATTLTRPRMSDTVFEDCELSGARFVDATLTRVRFHRCRMSGFDAALGRFEDVRFSECRLDGANFRMLRAERLEFEACELGEADFYQARAPRARFTDCDLTRSDFSQAAVAGSRFGGSTLTDVRGAVALKGAVIDSSQIIPLALGVFAALDICVDDDHES